MEGGGFSPNPNFGSFPDTSMDLDVMEELLLDGCWIEAKDGNMFSQQDPSASSSNDLSLLFNLSDSRTGNFGTNPHQKTLEETVRNLVSTVYPKIEDSAETQLIASAQSKRFLVEEADSGKSWWIGPKANAGPSSSPVKDRLVQAIENLQVAMRDKDFLIQIWVPVKKEGKNFLTTEKQPHSFNSNYLSLRRYREVSEGYNFPADGDSKESVGLPGRVFLGKLPEWTPDVRFFKSEEYPRIKFARKYDVCGSLALPVFERGSGTCLGVVEIVTTTQKINYRPELEDVCRALEAVDLRSSNNSNPLSLEFPHVSNELYQTELPRISEMLESICRSHGLPLALTWAPCFRQGKSGSRHSEENYSHCVSTIDSACFVPDQDIKSFLEACSEHHLLLGEGIVGRAFKTYKQCFATDVTAFSKTNYPLAHHAKIFGLHAGLAIPLRSLYSGSVELVLELFFPKDCLETEKQKKMLNLLTTTLQQNFKSLYLVMDKELEEEVILPVREAAVFSEANQEHQRKPYSSTSKETSPEESSWIAHMMEANRKGKGVSLSWEFQKEEPKDEFKLTWDNRNCQIVSEGKDVSFDPRKFQQNRGRFGVDGGRKSSYTPDCRQIPGRRRTKIEKTIGLEVLRQHFAGSLKDAAKSIGVCPTTLKRICRQHGIPRWPSRKIKKVGHSLQKLQLVIDSVQGVQGSIQLGSFYSSFPELSSPSFPAATAATAGPSSNPNENPKQLMNPQHPNSTSSSHSHSSGSSTCCSNQTPDAGKPPSAAGNPTGFLSIPRPHSDAELSLHAANREENRNLSRNWSQKTLITHPDLESLPPLPSTAGKIPKAGNSVKIKACLGDGKVRFTFPTQNCSFADLQQEVKTRFNINDMKRFDLKYLDDDLEWVLLTCDADLEECIDIYRSSSSMQSHTIKIAVQLPSRTQLGGSFGSSCPF